MHRDNMIISGEKQRIYKKAARNKVQHKILKQLETETEKQYHF